MGLFKSKEQKEKEKAELQERVLAPYVEKGFVISKVVPLRFDGQYFIVDTENKKWAYTCQADLKNGIVKIYSFKDMLKYEAISSKEDIQSFTTGGFVGGGLFGSSSFKEKDISYKVIVYTNSKDIDSSSLTILDVKFANDSILGFNGKMDVCYAELKKCLEYIESNRD